jgi:phage baseplate assembly protein W
MATIKYPLTAANGKLLLSQDDRATVEAITQVIQTRQGERVLRNYFGSDLNELDTLSDLSSVLATLEASISNGLSEYTSLAVGLEGSVDDDGVVTVYVEYQDNDQLSTATVTL